MPVEVRETIVSSTMSKAGGARRGYTRRKSSELSLEEYWDNRIREQEALTRKLSRMSRTAEDRARVESVGADAVKRYRQYRAEAVAARDAASLRRE